MNTIKINQLRIKTRIGCLAWEQSVQQTLIVDIEYGCDFKHVSARDDIKQAISYSSVAQSATRFGDEASIQLLETWICQLADHLTREFKMPWLRLAVSKNGLIENAKGVTVFYETGEQPLA